MAAAKTATEALRTLWQEQFFQEWRTFSVIVTELSSRHYHFPDSELGMALKRAKYLTRRGKPTHFEYIQKFPFEEDDING
jgi:hypothetical protein